MPNTEHIERDSMPYTRNRAHTNTQVHTNMHIVQYCSTWKIESVPYRESTHLNSPRCITRRGNTAAYRLVHIYIVHYFYIGLFVAFVQIKGCEARPICTNHLLPKMQRLHKFEVYKVIHKSVYRNVFFIAVE